MNHSRASVSGITDTLNRNQVLDLQYRYGGATTPGTESVTNNGRSRPLTFTTFLANALGNTRMVTDQNGAIVGSHDFYPFGAEIGGGVAQRGNSWGTNDYLTQKYMGQERDADTGFDHFPARHFGASLGRFVSPDPAGNFVADLAVPQSWNMYSYGLNNPRGYGG